MRKVQVVQVKEGAYEIIRIVPREQTMRERMK